MRGRVGRVEINSQLEEVGSTRWVVIALEVPVTFNSTRSRAGHSSKSAAADTRRTGPLRADDSAQKWSPVQDRMALGTYA